MIPPRGLIIAMLIGLGWASPGGAQSVADRDASSATFHGKTLYRIEPCVGFGLESIQMPVAGAILVDRFGLLHVAEPIQSRPGNVSRRAGSRAMNSAPGRGRVHDGDRLRAGSLSWPGAGGVVLYSPPLRYETYGGGYGRGPYGSVDCGMMYKGMALGY
jgi:hypothetical protein